MTPRHFRRALLRTLLSATVLSASSPATAGTMTGAATEWTQILNNIALLQQVIHMIRSVVQLKKQCEYAAQNLKHLGSLDEMDRMLGGISGVVSSTRGIVFAGESIARGYQDQISGPNTLSSQWAKTHPGRVDPRSLPNAQGNRNGAQVDADAFRRIDDSLQLAVKKSMATLDVQASQFDSDEEVFSKLKGRIDSLNSDDSKAGQMQAIIVGNALLAEILRQLMKLRQVLIAQANAMGEYQSAEAQRRQFADAIQQRQYGYTGAYRGDEVDFGAVLPGASSRSLLTAGVSAFGPVPQPGPAAPGAQSSGSTGASYVTSTGRTVIAAPGSSSSTLDSYNTDSGRSVIVAPGGTSPALDSYETSTGRTVIAAPGSSSPALDSFSGANGRSVILAPGSPSPSLPSSEDSVVDDGWEL